MRNKFDISGRQLLLLELHYFSICHCHAHRSGGRIVGFQFALKGLRSIGASPCAGLRRSEEEGYCGRTYGDSAHQGVAVDQAHLVMVRSFHGEFFEVNGWPTGRLLAVIRPGDNGEILPNRSDSFKDYPVVNYTLLGQSLH